MTSSSEIKLNVKRPRHKPFTRCFLHLLIRESRPSLVTPLEDVASSRCCLSGPCCTLFLPRHAPRTFRNCVVHICHDMPRGHALWGWEVSRTMWAVEQTAHMKQVAVEQGAGAVFLALEHPRTDAQAQECDTSVAANRLEALCCMPATQKHARIKKSTLRRKGEVVPLGVRGCCLAAGQSARRGR